jgi:hypothetical protein
MRYSFFVFLIADLQEYFRNLFFDLIDDRQEKQVRFWDFIVCMMPNKFVFQLY